VFRPPSTAPQTLGWIIPADTVALAIGPSELALRRGAHTIFYRYDGKPTGGGESPLWTEGVYLDQMLFLQRPASTAEDRLELWCVRRSDLKVISTCSVEDGVAVFR
jgi:hypothetical protein